ncbi:MAG: hypothetical protein RIM84_25995 [Alphaproteobacteria bacterium]
MIGLLQLVIVVAVAAGAFFGVTSCSETLIAEGYMRDEADRPMIYGIFAAVAGAMAAWAAAAALFGRKKSPAQDADAPDS